MNSSSTRNKYPLIIWAVTLLVSAAVIGSAMSGGQWLRSNVFELLPAAEYDALTSAATQAVDEELGTRLFFFAGHPDRSIAKSAADRLGSGLARNTLLADVTVRIDETRFTQLAEFYYPYRRQILSDEQLADIESDSAGIERRALARMFSPFGAGGAGLTTDPFDLFAGSLHVLRPAGGALSFDDGYLWAELGGVDYVLVMATLASPAMSIAEQETFAADVNLLIDNVQAGEAKLQFLRTGFSFYAHVATQSAKGEVSTIGVGSLIGLLLLIIATFRSLRPLTLVVVSIIAGCTMAMAVTLTMFSCNS